MMIYLVPTLQEQECNLEKQIRIFLAFLFLGSGKDKRTISKRWWINPLKFLGLQGQTYPVSFLLHGWWKIYDEIFM